MTTSGTPASIPSRPNWLTITPPRRPRAGDAIDVPWKQPHAAGGIVDRTWFPHGPGRSLRLLRELPPGAATSVIPEP
jgi:hypothetical protein